MPKKSSKRSGRKEPESAAKSKTTFKFCPYTGEKIWLTTVTLTEIKRVAKTGECPSSKKKELIRIPSKAERDKLYYNACDAIATRELQCLPNYGGRPWKVQCKLTEPKQSKAPLFRWFRGQLELACLPHLLERIPEPPRLRGKSMLDDVDEDEYIPTTALQERAVSALSEIAWNDREFGIPQVTVKYMSPNHTTWIGSRKAAYELRDELMERTLLLDKILHGYGARGQELRPVKAPKQQALHVGKLRFERDGLWVVGQEEAWQEERTEQLLKIQKEMEERKSKIGSKCEQIENAPEVKRPLSGLRFFIQSEREAYRAKKMAELQRRAETTESHTTTAPDAESEGATNESTTRVASSPKPPRMTLRDAERELRDVWKALSDDEQKQWKDRALQDFERQEQDGQEAGSATTEEILVDPPTVLEQVPTDIKDADDQYASVTKAVSATAALEPGPLGVVLVNDVTQTQSTATKDTATESNKPDSQVLEVTLPSVMVAATSNENERSLVSPSPPTSHSSEEDSVMNTESSVPAPVATVAKKRRALSACPPRRIQRSSHWRLKPENIDLCYQAAMDHYDTVMNTVKARALHNELQDGFDLLRERGRGRFDMELPVFDTPQFSFLTDIYKAAWMPIVRQILGDEVVLIHKGVFLSMPGAASQEYHQDGPHLNKKQQRPCHAINVFIPLVDLHSRNGPTEFCLGTHFLNYEGYVRDRTEMPQAAAGTPVIFDYRLGHRGMANTSQYCRPIVYCTYAATANGKEFRDSVNFSRKRYHRIGDLVEKPLSREERVKRRRQTIQEQKTTESEDEVMSEDIEEIASEATQETKKETIPSFEGAPAASLGPGKVEETSVAAAAMTVTTSQ